jgi:hypothetical protein
MRRYARAQRCVESTASPLIRRDYLPLRAIRMPTLASTPRHAPRRCRYAHAAAMMLAAPLIIARRSRHVRTRLLYVTAPRGNMMMTRHGAATPRHHCHD